MFFFQNPDPSQITGLYRNISMGRTTLQLQRRSPSASRLWGCAEQQAKHHKNGGKHESSSCKLITQFWRSKYRRIWTWNKLRCFTKKITNQSWWRVVPNQNLQLSSSINYFPSWPPRVHLHVEIQPPPACLHIDPQPANVNQIHRTWNPFVSTFFASTFEFNLVFPFHSELSATKAPSTI